MKSELETHLADAARDGKRVEAVVGPDLHAFARSWADENRTEQPPADRALSWASAGLWAAAGVLVAKHALEWAPAFPLRWDTVLMIPLIAAAAQLLLSPRVAGASLGRPMRATLALGAALGAVAFAGLLALRAFAAGGGGDALLVWSWPATLAVILLALAVGAVAVRRDPSAPRRARAH
jgi:hypothetical protein